MKKSLLILSAIFVSIFIFSNNSHAQNETLNRAKKWADSVYRSLKTDQRIAQLMVLRESGPANGGTIFINEINKLIDKYNIGAICLFQGEPADQADALNQFQKRAKTPLMVAIDGEMGLGMRMKTVKKFPDQLTMGAMNNKDIVYEVGKAMGEQCLRMGIHVNYAPVIDINNNAANPVIGYRSFGQDKYKVAEYGIQIAKGMEDLGVMACAKHFPGHGDVSVDSHYDLPVINKTLQQLDTLELYPFKEIFKAGIGSVMIAHLSIPTIESTPNLASSLSPKFVTGLLREKMGYTGISFTDALEMQGVAKFFPQGEIAAQSLIAGNDMLCLPGDIDQSIKKIKQAIRQKKLNWNELEQRIKKVLIAKYIYNAVHQPVIDKTNIVEDLNKDVDRLRAAVAEEAITTVVLDNKQLLKLSNKKIAYVAIGQTSTNTIAQLLQSNNKADIYNVGMSNTQQSNNNLLQKIASKNYDEVIVGIHSYSKSPSANFGISNEAITLTNNIKDQFTNTLLLTFGNPYAIKNFCNWNNIISVYEDDEIFQQAAYKVLSGEKGTKGSLPVTVCERFNYGTGLTINPIKNIQNTVYNFSKVDSIANEGIEKGAYPGCRVLVAKNGKIIYNKSYGYLDKDKTNKVTDISIYDLASVTKISATTISIMKLYEEGKIDLNKTLGDYLSYTKKSDKGNLKIKDILLHQAGLVSWIPFYKATIDEKTGDPLRKYYSHSYNRRHRVVVAKDLYLKNNYPDEMMEIILKSKLGPQNKYVYSDNDFIFLGKIVEALTGQSLDQYTKENFYLPLEMYSTTFNPLQNGKSIDLIAPTEKEKIFRKQVIHGYVHDPGAAMFGGIAGHAGLFSNAEDLSQLYRMLLNGGEWNGRRFFKKETIDLFTSYQSSVSRRGLGFDKPERVRKADDNYPAYAASPSTFGHTGFTGTCVWADPEEDLLYIFLSNRVHPDGQNPILGKQDIREKILDAIYEQIRKR